MAFVRQGLLAMQCARAILRLAKLTAIASVSVTLGCKNAIATRGRLGVVLARKSSIRAALTVATLPAAALLRSPQRYAGPASVAGDVVIKAKAPEEEAQAPAEGHHNG